MRHWGNMLNFKNNIVPCFSHSILGITFEEKSGNSDDDDFDYPRERFNE